MLKLSNEIVPNGTRITLRERWHEKLINFSKSKKYPYEYVLKDIVKKNKESYFIFQDDKGKAKVALTEFVAKYLLAKEVPDSNIGFSFKEYLPLEDTYILVTNMRNPNVIIPAILKQELELVEIEEESIIVFSFKLQLTIGSGFFDVRYYTEGSRKSTWKFVKGDDSYMSDYEMQFVDTIIHKTYVEKSIEKLARYLEKEKAFEHAKLLRQRGIVHDNSKMTCEEELHALARIIRDKSTLKDATKQLTPIKQDAIQLHWKNNSHHPEHFQSVLDMSKLDILEMCCDWHARSSQYKTDLLQYAQKQQEIRFHFPEWMFVEIMHYCRVLLSD